MSTNVDANLDILFAPEPDLQAAYDQNHDKWFNADPNSHDGKQALEQKRELLAEMSKEGVAPGQVDGALIPETTDEERQAELDELRRELGLSDDPVWQPTTEEECDRIGNKFVALDEEEVRIKKQYAKRLKSVQDRRNYLDFRYSSALDAFRREHAPKGKKSIDLPSCRLQSRTIAEHWATYDADMLQESLKQLPAETLKSLNLEVETTTLIKSTDKMKAVYKEAERRSIMKKAAQANLEVTGEAVEVEPLIAGIHKMPATEKFSVGGAK